VGNIVEARRRNLDVVFPLINKERRNCFLRLTQEAVKLCIIGE